MSHFTKGGVCLWDVIFKSKIAQSKDICIDFI